MRGTREQPGDGDSAGVSGKAGTCEGGQFAVNTVMQTIHYTLYREDADFVAHCIDYDVSSFGATEVEALANLREAVELHLEDAAATR